MDAVPGARRDVLVRLWQLYQHDLGEYEGSGPDASGRFPVSRYFDRYWVEAGRHPFEIRAGDAVAGFALVREVEPSVRSVAEFFVVRAFRGRGVGRRAATLLFDRFPGEWRVAQDEANEPAQRFWRTVIGDYTAGRFDEGWSDAHPRGPMQVFHTDARELNRPSRGPTVRRDDRSGEVTT